MTTTDSQPKTYKVGDIVSVDDPKFPGNWKIVKFNKTTVDLSPVGRVGRGLRAYPFLLKDPVEQTTQTLGNGTQVIGIPFQPVERPEGLRTGSVVTIKHQPLKGAPAGTEYYVVIKDNFDKVNLVPLGGNAERPDRYWSGVPVQRIGEVVEIKALLGH